MRLSKELTPIIRCECRKALVSVARSRSSHQDAKMTFRLHLEKKLRVRKSVTKPVNKIISGSASQDLIPF